MIVILAVANVAGRFWDLDMMYEILIFMQKLCADFRFRAKMSKSSDCVFGFLSEGLTPNP